VLVLLLLLLVQCALRCDEAAAGQRAVVLVVVVHQAAHTQHGQTAQVGGVESRVVLVQRSGVMLRRTVVRRSTGGQLLGELLVWARVVVVLVVLLRLLLAGEWEGLSSSHRRLLGQCCHSVDLLGTARSRHGRRLLQGRQR